MVRGSFAVSWVWLVRSSLSFRGFSCRRGAGGKAYVGPCSGSVLGRHYCFVVPVLGVFLLRSHVWCGSTGGAVRGKGHSALMRLSYDGYALRFGRCLFVLVC